MTDRERLELADLLLRDDLTFDANCVTGGLLAPTVEHAKAFAGRLDRLYRLIHPAVAECSHISWEAENERDYLEAKASGELDSGPSEPLLLPRPATARETDATCPDCGNRPLTEPRTVGCTNAQHLQADSLRRLVRPEGQKGEAA